MFESRNLENIMKRLEEIKKNLDEVAEITGTNKRVKQMREEITEIGWEGICSKYHPDINIDDPARNELFKMYKFIYDSMINNGEL